VARDQKECKRVVLDAEDHKGMWCLRRRTDKVGNELTTDRCALKGGGGCQIAAPPKLKFKKTHFTHNMIQNVLRDLHFSLNQPLKSADVL
jgi:hypothetical protein